MLRGTLLAGLIAITPAAANACDCVRLFPESPRFPQDVQRIAAFYPVAAEGIVERDGAYAWRFRPIREYRGPGAESYRIELLSDCSLDPQSMSAVVGKPVFLLLAGGDGPSRAYEIQRCVNLLGGEVEAAIRSWIEAGCNKR